MRIADFQKSMGCYRKPCSWNEPQYILMILLLSFDVSIQRHVGNHLALVGSSGARTPAGSLQSVRTSLFRPRTESLEIGYAFLVCRRRDDRGPVAGPESVGGESWIHDPSIAAAVARVRYEHRGFAENSGS
jgi:hypothetical protein